MLTEFKTNSRQVTVDEKGHLQGRYTEYWMSTHKIWIDCFYVDNMCHGEYKICKSNGQIADHCFYVKGKKVPFSELQYPATEEDRMYFTLKYSIPLLPVENLC